MCLFLLVLADRIGFRLPFNVLSLSLCHLVFPFLLTLFKLRNTATCNIPYRGDVALLRVGVRRNNWQCCGLLRFVAGSFSSWQPDVFGRGPDDAFPGQIVDRPAVDRTRAVRLLGIEETGR
jgi:hypothetical protein